MDLKYLFLIFKININYFLDHKYLTNLILVYATVMIKIKIKQIENDYPVQITTGNGTRYFCNEIELKYIKK